MKIYAFLLCLMVGAWEIGSEATETYEPAGEEQYTNIPRVDPDETDWAELDQNITRVDPDESDWEELDPDETDFEELDPDIQRGRVFSNGCPSSSACSSKCKLNGFKWGMCTGPNKGTCRCYRSM